MSGMEDSNEYLDLLSDNDLDTLIPLWASWSNCDVFREEIFGSLLNDGIYGALYKKDFIIHSRTKVGRTFVVVVRLFWQRS